MVNNYFNSRREQLVKYAITKETYPPDTQRGIEFILRDSNDSRHKVEQRLSYILNILPINYERIPVTAEEVFNKLDTKFFKMERQKKLIKDVYASRERAGRKGCCFLFVGPPGVGKTALMTAISEAMQLPFECIPLNGCSTPFELEGLDPGYDTADAGAIVRAFELHGTSEMILGLDEFDKVNRCSKEGDPMNVFLRLFQGLHYDKYLQCHISTENTIFIATANSIEDIPETILNRFNAIIYFDEYTHEDKFVIAKQYVIPEVLKIYNLSSANVTFEDCTIEYIIRVMIIIGPSGSGKTTLLHSILADYKSGTLLHPDELFSVVCEQVKHAKLAFPPRIKELLMVDDMDEIYKSGFEFKMVLYRIIKNYKGHLICCFNSYESAEEFINMFKKNKKIVVLNAVKIRRGVIRSRARRLELDVDDNEIERLLKCDDIYDLNSELYKLHLKRQLEKGRKDDGDEGI